MVRSFTKRRVFVASVAAVLSLVLVAGVVLARAPLLNAQKFAGFDRNEVLTYKYSGTYDGWAGARAAVDTVLESEWANRSYNASGLPTFQYSSTGTGTVYFTSAAESPCSDIGNTSWLACATNWGSSSFHIYIREFAASGKSSWVWNETGGCGSGETCWDLSRSLIHEAIHVTMGVGSHDELGESKTVMSSIQIAKSTAGWNTNHLQPCDEATGQLLYDVNTLSSRYSTCMADVADTAGAGLDHDAHARPHLVDGVHDEPGSSRAPSRLPISIPTRRSVAIRWRAEWSTSTAGCRAGRTPCTSR